MFMQIDQFNREDTGITGFVFELHATLVQKEELAHKIREVLKCVKVEGDNAVEAWQGKNPDPQK
eukprot:5896077-Ditylum_brightwellii.AAC.1